MRRPARDVLSSVLRQTWRRVMSSQTLATDSDAEGRQRPIDRCDPVCSRPVLCCCEDCGALRFKYCALRPHHCLGTARFSRAVQGCPRTSLLFTEDSVNRQSPAVSGQISVHSAPNAVAGSSVLSQPVPDFRWICCGMNCKTLPCGAPGCLRCGRLRMYGVKRTSTRVCTVQRSGRPWGRGLPAPPPPPAVWACVLLLQSAAPPLISRSVQEPANGRCPPVRSCYPPPPMDALEGGEVPPPLQGAQPISSHCLPHAKFQLQWHL